MPANTTTFIYSSNQSEPQQQQPPPPMQGVNPKTIDRLLLNGLNKDAIIDIHFEREVVKIPFVPSPNHYWARTSTKSCPLIQYHLAYIPKHLLVHSSSYSDRIFLS